MKGNIYYDGYRFKSEGELKRYIGLMEFVKSGRLVDFEVYPVIPLVVNYNQVCEYSPTFRFVDKESNQLRVIQVLSRSQTKLIELKIKLFEAIYMHKIELWSDG
jgi:hypothetical protein